MFFGCSSMIQNNSWRNPSYKTFIPNNVLVIGVTSDMGNRTTFESQLQAELNKRKVRALQSRFVFEDSFQNNKQTETDIKNQVDKLLLKGYDTIIITIIKGIEDNKSFISGSSKLDYRLKQFIGYYLINQDAFFDQNNYEEYKVFNIETSVYNLKKESDKALVWSGDYDVIDPKNTSRTIKKYANTIIKSLEKEGIIPKIIH